MNQDLCWNLSKFSFETIVSSIIGSNVTFAPYPECLRKDIDTVYNMMNHRVKTNGIIYYISLCLTAIAIILVLYYYWGREEGVKPKVNVPTPSKEEKFNE